MDNLVALGVHQAKSYFKFLFAADRREDILQEVHLCILLHPADNRARELELNRRLYALARSAGFRKRHMNEMREPGMNWWHRPVLNFAEVPKWKR